MSTKRKWIAGVLGALALGCAGASHATVYYLDLDACNGGCGLTNYGTVTVNTTPGMLSIEVSLANGVDFAHGDNSLDAIAFNIADRTSFEKSKVSTGGLSRDFTATSPFTGTPRAESTLGSFFYVVDWQPGASDQVNDMTFNVTQLTNPSFALGSVTDNGQAVYLSVDITRTVGNVVKEGVIGATLAPPPPAGVPEPTAWALMTLGFGVVGAGLRQRKAALAV
jgi:hypothetical protein